MESLEKRIKRRVLRPLLRRSPQLLNQATIDQAIASLYTQAEAGRLIAELRESIRPDKTKKRSAIKESPEEFLRLTKALHQAGRITNAELVLYADITVEQLVEQYHSAKRYDALLLPINSAIDELRLKHGLEDDDYWTLRDAPKEYRILSNAFDEVFRQAAIDVLYELGFEELANIRQASELEYSKLRERGRRKVMHEHEFVYALRDLVIRYEKDAEHAAIAHAYYGGITLLGAAVEGLLILRCLRSRHKAMRTAQKLPKNLKPHSNQEPQNWRFVVLIEVCAAAGWLPMQHVEWGGYKTQGLAHAIRHLRNFIHPALHAKERPWVEVDKVQWDDAIAMYALIRQQLSVKRKKPPISTNQQ